MDFSTIHEESTMTTKRPITVTIAIVLMILLTLFGALVPFFSGSPMLGSDFGPRPRMQGNFPANPPGGFRGNAQGGNPGNAPYGGFSRNGLFRLFRVLRIVQIVYGIILFITSVIAAYGLWKMKRWGMVLAIIIAVLALLAAAPSFLRVFSLLLIGQALLRIVVAIAIIVLVSLPISRKVYT
jgi:vacuolar-type H+-ATPase subunit I/STV1